MAKEKIWVTKRLSKKQSAAETYANRSGNYETYDGLNNVGQLYKGNDIFYVKRAFKRGWEAGVKDIKNGAIEATVIETKRIVLGCGYNTGEIKNKEICIKAPEKFKVGDRVKVIVIKAK